MSASLEYVTASGYSVADIVFAPLEAAGVMPNVVDVGARNGMFMLSEQYTKRSCMIGFEPNVEECEKLLSGVTDSSRAGYKLPRFKSSRYHNAAVWSHDGEATFFVTRGAGTSTMLGEFVGATPDRIFLDHSDATQDSLRDAVGEIQQELPVQCCSLDSVIGEDEIVDFLKIDVEGGECEVLEGTRALLSEHRVLFIVSEFFTVSFRQDCPVLADQWTFLHERGYRLIDMDTNHPRYSRDATKLPSLADRRMLLAGDAIFVLDPDESDLDPIQRQRMAAIALALGFNSLAVSLLREAGLTGRSECDAIEAALTHVPRRRRLRDAWQRFPTAVGNSLSSLKRRFAI